MKFSLSWRWGVGGCLRAIGCLASKVITGCKEGAQKGSSDHRSFGEAGEEGMKEMQTTGQNLRSE